MPTMKVDVFPKLKAILDSVYDPKGVYEKNPEKPDELIQVPGTLPTGRISLNAYDYAGFVQLCKQVKYKPEQDIKDLGGEAAEISVVDLIQVMAKATQDTAVEVAVPVDG